MAHLNPKQIHARLISTRDLLIELAQESQATLHTLTTSDTDADTWFEYRKLADSIQACASHATLLAASTSPKHEQPSNLARQEVVA